MPPSGCAGIVAVIAWMTSSKALGRREKETSTDISGETPAGTNRTKQLRRQTCKAAAEKRAEQNLGPIYENPLYHTQPTAHAIQTYFLFSQSARGHPSAATETYLASDARGTCTHTISLLSSPRRLALWPPPSERSLLGGRRSRLRERCGEGSDP